MVECTILHFDSELFGFKVAKILSPRLAAIELQKILMQLGTQDVRLVYWPSDSTDEMSQQAAKQQQQAKAEKKEEKPKDDNVVDADYEVKDKKKK